MRVYTLIGYPKQDIDPEVESRVSVFGAFSTEEKAMKIMNDLLENFQKNKESIVLKITLLEVDEPTELYNFFMNN